MPPNTYDCGSFVVNRTCSCRKGDISPKLLEFRHKMAKKHAMDELKPRMSACHRNYGCESYRRVVYGACPNGT